MARKNLEIIIMGKKNLTKEIRFLMERNDFSLLRESKHFIWKHKNGTIITTSKTPSDNYAVAQCSRQIRRIMGKVV